MSNSLVSQVPVLCPRMPLDPEGVDPMLAASEDLDEPVGGIELDQEVAQTPVAAAPRSPDQAVP